MCSNLRNFHWIWFVAVSFITGCAGVSPKPIPTPLDRCQQAYDQGRAQFTRELAAGDPNVEVYASDEPAGLDEQTGLPQVVVPGGISDKATAGRVSGHNDALHEYIDQYGLPASSRKKYEKDLFHLADYVERRKHERTPAHLVSGVGHEVSPDGRCTLMLRETSAQTRPSSPNPQLILIRLSNEQAVPFPSGAGDRPEVSLVWGPEGSDTAIFQFKPAGGSPLLAALDLRSGQWLRTEHASASDRLTRFSE